MYATNNKLFSSIFVHFRGDLCTSIEAIVMRQSADKQSYIAKLPTQPKSKTHVKFIYDEDKDILVLVICYNKLPDGSCKTGFQQIGLFDRYVVLTGW